MDIAGPSTQKMPYISTAHRIKELKQQPTVCDIFIFVFLILFIERLCRMSVKCGPVNSFAYPLFLTQCLGCDPDFLWLHSYDLFVFLLLPFCL